jgi:hypothetical protein
MKFTKQFILPALVCCGILVSVVSCTDESIESTDVAVKSKSARTSRLSALHDKVKPSKADVDEYVKTLRSLSFEESLEYREIQREKIISEQGNTPEVIEGLEKDKQWFKGINEKSMELFGKPILQITDSQMDKVFSNYETMNNKQSKVVAQDCPVVPFNQLFPKSNKSLVAGDLLYETLSIREVQQPEDKLEKQDKDNSKGDCDCELEFLVPDKNFNHLLPVSGGVNGISDAHTLLSLFNNTVNGSMKFSKIRYNVLGEDGIIREAKEYYARPVFGKKRVRLVYLDLFNRGCQRLWRQYLLTDDVVRDTNEGEN